MRWLLLVLLLSGCASTASPDDPVEPGSFNARLDGRINASGAVLRTH